MIVTVSSLVVLVSMTVMGSVLHLCSLVWM